MGELLFTGWDLFFYTCAMLVGIHCIYLMDRGEA
jgi:hypothetical protein